MPRNVIGICNLHNSPSLDQLTEKRSYGTVTVLGRYAMMDFALSNFCNSNIDRVITLVDNFPNSVSSHRRSGNTWTTNMKTGFQFMAFNEKGILNPSTNTDINNCLSNMSFINELNFSEVVITCCHFLCSMDFRPMIEYHREHHADITCVYSHVTGGTEEFIGSKKITLDDENKVKKVVRNDGKDEEADISLETFVVSREKFYEILEKAPTIDKTYSFEDMIIHLFEKEKLDVYAYCFEHFVTPMTTLKQYVENSFKLLRFDNRRKLFRKEWPIYTTTHETPPAKYGPDANVSDSIISNGCKVNGKVEHSILSRNVTIDKGVKVSNSIIFTDSVITNKAKVKNIITDKNVYIDDDIIGKDEEIMFVKNAK